MNTRAATSTLLATALLCLTRDAAAQTYVRVNQAGYLPHDAKIALAFAAEKVAGNFTVVDASTGAEAWKGETRSKPGSWGAFSNFVELDFSALEKPGHYQLRVGETNSPAFEIAEHVYGSLPDELLEFMREQRCGYNPFLDEKCHQGDGRTAYGPEPAGTFVDAAGGWHDAGDLLKYLLTSGNATAQLLMAWQEAADTSLFKDATLADGRPGANGIPDVLDETRWGLEWMLKLHPKPDQLYHQVADDRDHAGWRLPKDDDADYGWGKGSNRVVYFADGKPQGLKKYQSESTGLANLAGRYAAAMGLAAVVWKERDATFAERCLKAGLEVYALGRAKEGVQQGNSYGSSYRYAETTWADDMEWGAAELFGATRREEFLTDAKRYAALAADESWMGKAQTGHYQYYPFFNAGHYALSTYADPATKKALAEYYRAGIERCVAAGDKNPYEIGMPFIWCSNNLLAALVTQCALYERMTGDARFHQFGCRQRDWLLGRNPWGTSMFTGLPEGGVWPHHPHLMTVSLTGRQARGGLVDGPVYERIFTSLKGVRLSVADSFAAFQSKEAVYHDDTQDYSSNEPTMDGTASAILMWALF